MIFELLHWWYGRGWELMITQALHRLGNLGAAFSVSILLRTLFSPWRRIISYPGAGLDARLRAMLDNLVSRAVGFVVRLLVLLTVAILGVLAVLVGLLQILIWPVFPLLVFAPILGAML
ncbi:hypothetical protein BH09PAT4_BH09PAT4_04750 [soil metagenome]